MSDGAEADFVEERTPTMCGHDASRIFTTEHGRRPKPASANAFANSVLQSRQMPTRQLTMSAIRESFLVLHSDLRIAAINVVVDVLSAMSFVQKFHR